MNIKKIAEKNRVLTVAMIAKELNITPEYCAKLLRKNDIKPNGVIRTGKPGKPVYTYSRQSVNILKRAPKEQPRFERI